MSSKFFYPQWHLNKVWWIYDEGYKIYHTDGFQCTNKIQLLQNHFPARNSWKFKMYFLLYLQSSWVLFTDNNRRDRESNHAYSEYELPQ